MIATTAEMVAVMEVEVGVGGEEEASMVKMIHGAVEVVAVVVEDSLVMLPEVVDTGIEIVEEEDSEEEVGVDYSQAIEVADLVLIVACLDVVPTLPLHVV
jgi:hypothetical protein